MTQSNWLEKLPVLGDLPPDEAAAKLREIGEDDVADVLSAAAGEPTTAFGVLSKIRLGGICAWQHTAHAVGYLAPLAGPASELQPVHHAANIAPDETLKGAAVKLTLDGLRVADYPGRGIHQILFDFSARNESDQGGEQLHFSTTYRVAEGEQAAVLGRPIFVGLNVGFDGLFLQCGTVNILNEGDEEFLKFLDGDTFKAGLKLLTTAQPALAPFSALAVGLTTALAKHSRNQAVQAVDIGLDFSSIAMRPRLAEGSYIAVQIPENLKTVWRWEDWSYDPVSGRLVSADQVDQLIPYNYFVVSVSRMK